MEADNVLLRKSAYLYPASNKLKEEEKMLK